MLSLATLGTGLLPLCHGLSAVVLVVVSLALPAITVPTVLDARVGRKLGDAFGFAALGTLFLAICCGLVLPRSLPGSAVLSRVRGSARLAGAIPTALPLAVSMELGDSFNLAALVAPLHAFHRGLALGGSRHALTAQLAVVIPTVVVAAVNVELLTPLDLAAL